MPNVYRIFTESSWPVFHCFSSPTVANGIVYIGGGANWSTRKPGSVYAVNASTGALVCQILYDLIAFADLL
jgi:hypothetical protein